ncbi:MAG: rhodanese family protein [Moraxella sp.]
MSLTSLTPKEAAEKMKHKAVLIDIRHTDEYLRKHITGAISLPLNTLAKNTNQLPQNGVVIFGCLSGMRTQQNANLLENYSKNCQEAYILQGGLMAWEKAGLPIEAQPNAPLELMRQVQLIAGVLVLLGVTLGITISPWFLGISGFVGMGLMLAGLTGFCGLAKVLMLMPWNATNKTF